MCLAQGPQRSDAGELADGISGRIPLVWYQTNFYYQYTYIEFGTVKQV